MKQAHFKSIMVTIVMATSLLALTGCGTSSAANTNAQSPAKTTAQTKADPSVITSQQQVKSIDIKSTSGQQQVNTQIDKNLQSLDKSLNALDKSLGQL